MKNTNTVHGIPYWTENGKFTIDGYDFFDTLQALANDVQFQILWTHGAAFKNASGEWVVCL